MMEFKQFQRLALVALVSLVVAGFVHSSYNDWSRENLAGEKLLPSLANQADKLGKITVQQGEKKLTFERAKDGKGWGVAERNGFPVDAAKVREMVVNLAQMELVERKTKNKERFGLLELEDPSKKDAKSKLVRLSDADNKTVAELVVGKSKRSAFGSGKSGIYVRQPGKDQTWLATGEVSASLDVVDWVKPAFFQVDKGKIASVAVSAGDQAVFEVIPDPKKKGDFKIAKVPEGKKPNDRLRVGDIVNGIRTLELKDMRSASDADKKPDMTAIVETTGGAKYKIGLKKDGKKRWMTVSVLAEGKDKKAAETIKANTGGWAFEVADWRANQTFKEEKDVFEVVEKPKAEDGETPKAPGSDNNAAPKNSN